MIYNVCCEIGEVTRSGLKRQVEAEMEEGKMGTRRDIKCSIGE